MPRKCDCGFQVCGSDRLTWWIDHHQSAFLTPEDETHFRLDHSGKKFYDPSSNSSRSSLQQWLGNTLVRLPRALRTVYWADIIDGAMYGDAKTGVEVGEPAQKLAAVIEAGNEPDFRHGIIRQLARQPLNNVTTQAAGAQPLRTHREEARGKYPDYP